MTPTYCKHETCGVAITHIVAGKQTPRPGCTWQYCGRHRPTGVTK